MVVSLDDVQFSIPERSSEKMAHIYAKRVVCELVLLIIYCGCMWSRNVSLKHCVIYSSVHKHIVLSSFLE